ncbi:MAG: Na+/H+ antiporter subunit E [Clostridiales bacterium]|nr:Na+/H+ antiporter subunit E [Clostridiales bacterium]
MYIIFFLLWIILNGRITLEIVLFGVVISALMYAFVCKFMDYSPKRDWIVFKKTGYILQYIGILIVEIVKANMSVVKLILSSKYEPEPVIIRFKTDLKTKTAKVVLANSITLTPGTITASLEEDEFIVHCLDKAFAEGMDSSIFVKLLKRMESV